MMKNTKIASLGLAVASLAGVAATTAAVAPAASATTYHRYIHNSAHYTSKAQCEWYAKNDLNYVARSSKFGGSGGVWGCQPQMEIKRSGMQMKPVIYWSFGQLSYLASGPIWPGDRLAPSSLQPR